MSRMTATDAARSFSDVLNRVGGGEEIEVTRNGAAIAVIGPPVVRLLSAERFRELIATAPAPDDDFADEIRQPRRAIEPPLPSWPS